MAASLSFSMKWKTTPPTTAYTISTNMAISVDSSRMIADDAVHSRFTHSQEIGLHTSNHHRMKNSTKMYNNMDEWATARLGTERRRLHNGRLELKRTRHALLVVACVEAALKSRFYSS